MHSKYFFIVKQKKNLRTPEAPRWRGSERTMPIIQILIIIQIHHQQTKIIQPLPLASSGVSIDVEVVPVRSASTRVEKTVMIIY